MSKCVTLNVFFIDSKPVSINLTICRYGKKTIILLAFKITSYCVVFLVANRSKGARHNLSSKTFTLLLYTIISLVQCKKYS